jgi:hypothetical protein
VLDVDVLPLLPLGADLGDVVALTNVRVQRARAKSRRRRAPTSADALVQPSARNELGGRPLGERSSSNVGEVEIVVNAVESRGPRPHAGAGAVRRRSTCRRSRSI